MLSSAQLAVFVPAALAVAASPGANNLLAFRNGLRQGLRPAAVALTGRFAAFALMLGAVVTGLGALLHTSRTAFEILRVVGAVVMVGLGVWVVWSARAAAAAPASGGDPPGQESEGVRGTAVWKPAAQEFVTAAANPKALLLFTAFLPPFVSAQPGAAAAGAQLAALGALYMVCEAATALGWAAAGRVLAGRRLRPVTLRRLDQASGGALIAFGGGLALADLSRR
ncbi:LysE family translocator [Nocardiopsis ganjiahuensis]|uniref:LysE family translocator n=1 Tax=Nocardiopsis ganjiahuensis TaxID=239984 RepID=UPI00034DC3F0|nr:LysE family translocator [Nocardiopsis ganjiahuensis]